MSTVKFKKYSSSLLVAPVPFTLPVEKLRPAWTEVLVRSHKLVVAGMIPSAIQRVR